MAQAPTLSRFDHRKSHIGRMKAQMVQTRTSSLPVRTALFHGRLPDRFGPGLDRLRLLRNEEPALSVRIVFTHEREVAGFQRPDQHFARVSRLDDLLERRK